MEITALLQNDHREVEALFEQLGAIDGGREAKAMIAGRIFDALDVHAKIEEAIFYPDLEPAAPLLRKVAEAYQEHAAVKQLIARLRAMGPAASEFDELMQELRENVERHVDEEEGELFPAARAALGVELLEQAGAEAVQMRQLYETQGDLLQPGM